jgi:hypothetical protein
MNEQPVNAAEAREEVAKLVRSRAVAITEKLIELAKEGQLGHAKYLFEVAGIHPSNPEEASSKPEESEIYNWLKELGLPTGRQEKDTAQEDGSGEGIL